MYELLRRILFAAPPETAHRLALNALRLGAAARLVQKMVPAADPLPVRLLGLEFPNPVGLAAGLDKNGDYIDALGALGFGFIEIGTVTPRPQYGNPKPRLFRLPEERALINRLGFNNKGVDHLVARVSRRRYSGILGINIGKNRETPHENAAEDYLLCLSKVYASADYVTVNISSPNTEGLRALQTISELDALLDRLFELRQKLATQHGKLVPLLVKIAPDLEPEAVTAMAQVFKRYAVDGLLATNTTLDHSAVSGLAHAGEPGGLSGAPLLVQANRVLSALHGELDGTIPLIGLGGICSAADAVGKLRLGARLVQLYTGFIYAGPALIRESVEAIRNFQDTGS